MKVPRTSKDEFYDDSPFLNIEHRLLGDSILKSPRLQSGRAIAHLREGFDRRLLMMQCSRRTLKERCQPDRSTPLSPYEVEELNVHLNGYYVTLRGALDNLAWALKYERGLVPEADEDDPRTRSLCNLFHKKFLQELIASDSALGQLVSAHATWEAGLRELRDPAAHRVPLSVIGGVLLESDRAEYERLHSLAGAPESELGGRSRGSLVHEAYSLLKPAALLELSAASGRQWRSIPDQLGDDHQKFLGLANGILQSLWGTVA